jgi:hypothetical protein
MQVYPDVRAAREEIREYLCYYDTKRRHSSLNYLTRANSSSATNEKQ